jgi:hypothetical protein
MPLGEHKIARKMSGNTAIVLSIGKLLQVEVKLAVAFGDEHGQA